MPVRQLLAVGLWLCVTASATAVVWTGTSTVAADLTDRPAPVVAHRDVVSDLQTGSSDSKTAPGIRAPDAKSPTSTVPADRLPSSPTGPATPLPGSSGSQTPQSPVATTIAPATPPAAPPAGGLGGPPPTAAPRQHTAAYSTAGGVVTVACSGYFFIDLLSATPNNGYAVKVVTPGPAYVEVHFVGAGQDVAIWAICFGDPIRVYGGPPRPRQVP